jgi:hypothetical protein
MINLSYAHTTTLEVFMHKRLAYPCPRRATARGEGGLYTVPFTEATILSSLAAGGRFVPGGHDFASPKAAKYATMAGMFFDELWAAP